MMKKSSVFFLLTLGLAFGAGATSVTAVDAAKVARAWAARKGRLGVRLGTTVARTDRHLAANGDAFYAVKLQGAGTVFVSGDTDDAPVVGFTGSEETFAEIDPKSPLRALLDRDRELRAAARPLKSPTLKSASLQALGASSSADDEAAEQAAANADEWAALLREADALPAAALPQLGAAIPPYSYETIGDVRVAPLLKTKWSQSTNCAGRACMNYFTPNGPDPAAFTPDAATNLVCGCGATAVAQVMYYFRYPSGDVAPATRECSWCDTNKLSLTTQGGAFAWDLMPLAPLATASDAAACEAVGKLASDAGIALRMNYNVLDENREPTWESGTFAFLIPGALMKTFGYGNAVYCKLYSGLTGETTDTAQKIYQRTLYANLDAGLPVLVGLSGHEVVGDGYGFVDGSDYVHLNMGWAGQNDFWYRLPEVKYSEHGMMTFENVNYNVFTNATVSDAVFSGRVLDAEGLPAAGLRVKVLASDSGETMAETVTSDSGVWGVVLPEGRYDVEVKKAGFVATEARGLRLSAPEAKVRTSAGVYAWTDESGESVVALSDDVLSVASADGLGNVWGVTQTLNPAKAAVYSGEDCIAYCDSLDAALAATEGVAEARIEIWDALPLGGIVTNGANCVIVATNAIASESAVTCASGAKIVVADGATLTLSNVVLSVSEGVPVEVVAGGKVRLGGVVDIASLVTADSAGLEVFAPLETSGILLQCAAAVQDGDPIGTVSGDDFLAISNTVGRLLKADDEEMSGFAVEEGRRIVWARQPCDKSVAEAGVVTGGVTNYYRRLERVLSDYLDEADEIWILRDCEVTSPREIRRDVRMTAAEGVAVSAGPKAGFTVTDGALTVVGATFGDYCGKGLFVVSNGVVNLEDCVFTNVTAATRYSGVLQVAGGAARVSRCRFDGCCIPDEVNSAGYGAGIWVRGGARLAFLSSTIVNGYAKSYGGGIYADKGSSVTIGGAGTVVEGNGSGNFATDNIYVSNANVAFEIDGEMSGERCVGVRVYGRNSAGSAFAAFAATPTAEAAEHAAAAFSSDADATLSAVVSEGTLCWAAAPIDDHTVEDPSDAVAFVQVDGSSVVKYYPTIEYALAAVTEDGTTVTLMRDCTLAASVTVSNAVTLVSASGESFTVERTAGVPVIVSETGSLALENVTVASSAELAASSSCRLFDVDGGSMTLAAGATVRNVSGTQLRAESAVYVHGGGVFRMEDGAVLENDRNDLSRPGDGAGYGGALLADEATLELFGGTIRNSVAARFGGGVFAGNRSTVRLTGAITIDGNANLSGEDSNLTVSDNSTLELVGALTGEVGIYPGEAVDKAVFGVVTASLDDTALTNSAYRFSNDLTGAYGVPARRADGKSSNPLLIWSRAFDQSGRVTVEIDGTAVTYACVGDIPINEIPVYPTPIAFSEIVRDPAAKTCTVTFTNLVRGCWYALYATNSLAGGFPIDAAVQAPVTNFQAEADGAFTFTLEADDAQLFWRATAEEGVVYP